MSDQKLDTIGLLFFWRIPQTMKHQEHPLLVVDLVHERGKSFRAVPSRIFSIDANLSECNMDFAEFANWVDDDGVHRG